ncbi:MAG: hypothetical protein ACFE9Z_13515 [Promethearchaeota archaeon]
MRFISGLKNLSKKTLLLVIVILFIISWLLFTIGFDLFNNNEFSRYFLIFLLILASFTLILFIISFIKKIEEMKFTVIIIALILTVPITIVFLLYGRVLNYVYLIFLYANTIITAFFAFKFCIDTSISLDNYLYDKHKSRKITRPIELIGFFLLSWWVVSLIIRFVLSSPQPGVQNVSRSFFNLFIIGIILIGVVLIRLLFKKKLAAYITFFNLLTIFYVLYMVLDLWAEFIFFDTSGYDIFSFCIDLLLFIYIIGSIYDRVEYIKEKLKIFKVDTIALFVILLKLFVQIVKIIQALYLPYYPAYIIQQIIVQVQVLWICFVIIIFIFGIYMIVSHKEGKTS